MQGITNYDKWKFRRCIETIRRYGCTDLNNMNKDTCKICTFNIDYLKWDNLHIKLTLAGDPYNTFNK